MEDKINGINIFYIMQIDKWHQVFDEIDHLIIQLPRNYGTIACK